MTIKHGSKAIEYDVLKKHRDECKRLAKGMFEKFTSIFDVNSKSFVLYDMK